MDSDEDELEARTNVHAAAMGAMALAAAQVGNTKALECALAEPGVHPDMVRDAAGCTPLLAAAQGGHTDCAMTLLRWGASLSATNLRGQDALSLAFSNEHTALGTAIAAIGHNAGGLSRDWATCAGGQGVDVEAIDAAMDLGLDLKIFEPSKPAPRENMDSNLSASARFLATVAQDLVSDTELSSGAVDDGLHAHRGSSHKPPQVPGLRLYGHGSLDIDPAAQKGSSKRHAVPGLRLHGETKASMSASERELEWSALEARQAEAQIYLAADLGHAPRLDAKTDQKKREKMRKKCMPEDDGKFFIPAQRGAHVSESIVLMGKTQAAFESDHLKTTKAQQEAADLDFEIQQQLDQKVLSAAQNLDWKGMKSWLEKGAQVNAQDTATGNSALHYAAVAGNKKACKALMREGAEPDVVNGEGESASDSAFRHSHTELGEYLNSKIGEVNGNQNVHEAENRQQLEKVHSSVRGNVEDGFQENDSEGYRTRTMGSRNSAGKQTVEGDVKGMVKQLRLLDMTTFPRDTENYFGWDSGQDSEDDFIALDPLCSAQDDDDADYDVLKCAEEFLQTVSPVRGKGAFTDLDSLLEEAERAVMGQHDGLDEDEKEGDEFDALAHLARILKNNPVPPRTILQKITTEEDAAEIYLRRGLELTQMHRVRADSARPRILNGVALIIANTGLPQADGLCTNNQFTCDLIQLEKTLPLLGFEYVEIKRDLTRGQIMDEVFETCSALCPGGNLQNCDGLLLIVMSTGGPTSFDAKPAPGANAVSFGAASVGFQELVNLVKVIPNKPKIVLLNICGDPEERKRANREVPLRPTPCVPNLYQKMLDGCNDVLLVLNVTNAKVHWVPRAGSLVMRFFLEEINDEGINKDLAEIISGVRTRLLEYFYSRRGTGKPQCPVGRGEYDNFFLQAPLFTEGESNCAVMLGPGLKFAKNVCGADFLSQDGFLLTNRDTCVVKDMATHKYVHAYGVLLPRTCEGIVISLGNFCISSCFYFVFVDVDFFFESCSLSLMSADEGTPNLGWQIVIHEIDGSEVCVRSPAKEGEDRKL